MVFGIIAAEEKEMLAIKNLMKNLEEEKIYNLIFYRGIISEKTCVLTECGIGKVNAARVTQILIDKYSPDFVINVGSAGAVNPELNIEDIVIGDKLIQYDFDVTEIGDYEKGEICGIGKYFFADRMLIEKCKETIEELSTENKKIVIGLIGSADLFCGNVEKAFEIRNEFNAQCVEMEGAAIAQVCTLDKVPFIVIRAISDTPNGNNKIDFHEFLELVSKNMAEFLGKLLYEM